MFGLNRWMESSSSWCSCQVSLSCGIREGLSLSAGAAAHPFSQHGPAALCCHRHCPTSGCKNYYCSRNWEDSPFESFVQVNISSVRFCYLEWKLERGVKFSFPTIYQFSGWRYSREYLSQAIQVSFFLLLWKKYDIKSRASRANHLALKLPVTARHSWKPEALQLCQQKNLCFISYWNQHFFTLPND